MSEGSLERTDIRIRPLPSCGAINPPTPNDLPPHLSHPAREPATPMPKPPGTFCPATAITTPMVRALDLSEGAMASATSILGSPPLSTRPGRARHPRFQRRVFSCQPFSARHPLTPRWHLLSHPAMGLTTPKGTAAGCFLRDHTSHDTHIGCVPSFYPGQTLPDPHNRYAGYFLRGANCWPSPINQAPLSFLTWPPEPRHPGAPRQVFSVRGHQKHDTHGSVAPYTFLPGLKRFVTHTWCAGYFRVHPSKIRHPPEWRWTPGGPSNADTHRRHAPFFLTRPFSRRHPIDPRRVLSWGALRDSTPIPHALPFLLTRPVMPRHPTPPRRVLSWRPS